MNVYYTVLASCQVLNAGRELLQSGAQAGAAAQSGSNGFGGSESTAQAQAQAQSGLDGGDASATAQAIANSGVRSDIWKHRSGYPGHCLHCTSHN